MKKKIIIISVILVGFVLAATANSWAQRDRVGQRHQDSSGRFQKWDKPAAPKFGPDRGRSYHPKKHHDRQGYRFHPGFHRPRYDRAPHHYWQQHRQWRHRPYYRQGHPRLPYWRHRHAAVINRYDSPVAREEAFHAAAAVSDSGFLVSVGVSQTR